MDELVESDRECPSERTAIARSQIIINEACRQVRELGCGLVADGTIGGNGVWFDSLRAQDRESA